MEKVEDLLLDPGLLIDQEHGLLLVHEVIENAWHDVLRLEALGLEIVRCLRRLLPRSGRIV